MTISKEYFNLITLRPAKFSSSEVELKLDFTGCSLSRTPIVDAKILNLLPGDTVEAYVRVIFDDEKGGAFNYIHVYLSGDVLTKFIDKYGISDIDSTVRGKFRLEYKTTDNDELLEEYYEIIAFVMIELY